MYHYIERCRGLRRNHQDLIVLNGLQPALRQIGEEHARTIHGAICYANSLVALERFEEAKALLNKALPVAQRVLGGNHDLTLMMQLNIARALYKNSAATLDDLREAVTTLEETNRIARRVLGGAHPLTAAIEMELRRGRATLRAREPPPRSA